MSVCFVVRFISHDPEDKYRISTEPLNLFGRVSQKPQIFGPLRFGMATSAQIKTWIQEIRTVRPVSAAAILVRQEGGEVSNTTHITLLDTACCVPAIRIPKAMDSIERTDLEFFTNQLNHSH